MAVDVAASDLDEAERPCLFEHEETLLFSVGNRLMKRRGKQQPAPSAPRPFHDHMVGFRNGVVRSLRVADVPPPEVVIGHEVLSLSMLSWAKERWKAECWLDCVEMPDLLERVGSYWRNQPRQVVDDTQRQVDEHFSALDGVLTVSRTLGEVLEEGYSDNVVVIRNFRSKREADGASSGWLSPARGSRLIEKRVLANPPPPRCRLPL